MRAIHNPQDFKFHKNSYIQIWCRHLKRLSQKQTIICQPGCFLTQKEASLLSGWNLIDFITLKQSVYLKAINSIAYRTQYFPPCNQTILMQKIQNKRSRWARSESIQLLEKNWWKIGDFENVSHRSYSYRHSQNAKMLTHLVPNLNFTHYKIML